MARKKKTSALDNVKSYTKKLAPYAGTAIAAYAAGYGVPPATTLGVLSKLAGLFG